MTRWRVEEAPGRTRLCLARALRTDIAAETFLPAPEARDPVRFRRALAHQLRQDLWRALRRVRGFAPVIELTETPKGLRLSAGGALLAGRAPAGTEARIAALIEDPAHRARWLAHALRRAGGRA